MNFGTPSQLRPDLNITPLIDVVLMLLIFFMISTSFVFQPGIMVKLPAADTTETTAQQGAQVIITAESEIYFDRIRTTLDELPALMRGFKDKSVLVIKADRAVTHGTVVAVMNHAKASGFKRFAIATQPGESAGTGEVSD